MPNSDIPDIRKLDLESIVTMRPPAGEPVNPPSSQQPNPSLPGDASRTLKLPIGRSEPSAEGTQRLVFSRQDGAPLRMQKVDHPSGAAGQTLKVTFLSGSESPRWKVPLVLGLLVVLGGGAYLAFFRKKAAPRPPGPVTASTFESIPPAARATLEQARAGDPRAMHMLGLMYYNGLNLPQDREKGLYWLRKAAEKGSVGARVELSQIEAGR